MKRADCFRAIEFVMGSRGAPIEVVAAPPPPEVGKRTKRRSAKK